jgi:tRNA(Ile)-lysidine synthase
LILILGAQFQDSLILKDICANIMLEKVQKFIRNNKLFTEQDNLLLAVSGGVDSVFLAYTLQKLGYKCSIAHCNFGLRGEESDGDEEFVVELANKLNLEIHTKSFDMNSSTDSVQLVARELRYNWFAELSNAFGFDLIVTAHHKGDVIETILMNLGRGTGTEGLHGILPLNDMNVARPLLCLSKSEILEYCRSNNIGFREDSSNKTDNYLRNSIRHNLVPEYGKIFPDVEDRVFDTSFRVQEYEKLFQEMMNEKWEHLSSQKGGLTHISLKLLSKTKNKDSFLFYALHEYGFARSDINSILETDQSGKRIEAEEYILYRDREDLILSPRDNYFNQVIQIEVQNKVIDFPDGKIQVTVDANIPDFTKIDKNECFLDAGRLTFPLTLRKWRKGDKFQPLGMHGFKKISDFLIDEKVPIPKKELVHVLCSGEDIVWVIGMRADNRFKINSHTEEVLSLSLL